MKPKTDERFTLTATPAADAISVLTCRRLPTDGLVHGFSTRLGGVCGGHAASLNFGSQGATPAERRQNLERLAVAVGFDADALFRVHQVHGDRVVILDEHSTVDAVGREQADAMVTATPGQVIAIQTADCVPVLLCDAEKRVVGGAHAGWRGLVAGVIENTVAVMVQRFGCAPRGLLAAVGPSIGRCCFEVGSDVAEHFDAAMVQSPEAGGRPRVDLRAAARGRLLGAGLDQDNIAVTTRSTCCEGELFYSYRCQGETTGRQLSLIGYGK